MLPIQSLSREAEDFLRVGKHSKHVLLLTYLALLQLVINNLRLIFKPVKIKNVILAVKTLIKKAQSSNHINQKSFLINYR